MSQPGLLSDLQFAKLVIAVLIKRLNNNNIVSISQANIDDIAYCKILEGFNDKKEFILKVEKQPMQ